jgi:DNA-3-methyladenine glycosylase
VLPLSFYTQNALNLAVALLGCELVHVSKEGTTAGVIVETEAYNATDPASHSFGGQTARNAVMFGPPGHAYIYLSYGIHLCFNVVGGRKGVAEAVLIRALEPTHGTTLMQQRRHTEIATNLCSGPGKLVQAMGLQRSQNGASLTSSELFIRPHHQPAAILASPRIGISRAVDQPWRFFVAKNPHVTSHKFNVSAVPFEYEAATMDQL